MLKTPLKVVPAKTALGASRIVDADGRPVCSFGNQARHRGADWAWEVAKQIVRAVNVWAMTLDDIAIWASE